MKAGRCVAAGLLMLTFAGCEHRQKEKIKSPQAGPPQRIVTLAPHLAELVFVAGAGDLLVGTVEYSDHPDQANDVPRIGDAYRVDAEMLATLNPDLLLAWSGGNPDSLLQFLRQDGYRVIELGVDGIESVAVQLRLIGKLTERTEQAERAAVDYLASIDELRATNVNKPIVSVFYQISARPLFTVGGQQIISEVISLCGGKNIFSDLDTLAPAVSMESVLLRNPQVILAGSVGDSNPLEYWHNYPQMLAVSLGNLFILDSELLGRAGPRLADGAAQVCHALDLARGNLAEALM